MLAGSFSPDGMLIAIGDDQGRVIVAPSLGAGRSSAGVTTAR